MYKYKYGYSFNGGAGELIQRYFTLNDPVARTIINLTSAANAATDFKLIVKTAKIQVSGDTTLISRNAGGVRLFFVNFSLDVVYYDGSSFYNMGTLPNRTDLHELELERISGTMSLKINGVSTGITFSVPNDFGVDCIGRAVGPAPTGYVADVQLFDNGTEILNMPIDQEYDSTNNTVLDLSPIGNNGTYTNLAVSGNSEFFTLSASGTQWDGALGTTLVIG